MLYTTQEMLGGQSFLMLYWAFVVADLEAEPWALHMLRLCSVAEPHPQSPKSHLNPVWSKKKHILAREVTQQPRAFSALAEDQNSVPGTH